MSASLAAQALNRYLRLTMKPKPMHLMDADELRLWFERRALPIKVKGVDIERTETGPVVGEWQRPRGGAERTILFLHGGGYVFGSIGLYRSFSCALAKAAGANVFSLAYRLAPESKCPAAIEDAVSAYERLVASGCGPGSIFIAGDSAGGGLALAALQALNGKGAPAPSGGILFSPWTDLAATGASVAANAHSDCMFREDSVRAGGLRYAGSLDLKDPRVSPLYGEFRGLPPLLVFASRSEMLFDDSARIVEKAKAAGVAMRFEARDGLCHVWPMFAPLIPEAREALMICAEFVRSRAAAAAERRSAA
jgi:acetyl esterase/lipase